MNLTYSCMHVFLCMISKEKHKIMNLIPSKTLKKTMSCMKLKLRATGEIDRRRCGSCVAVFVHDQ